MHVGKKMHPPKKNIEKRTKLMLDQITRAFFKK